MAAAVQAAPAPAAATAAAAATAVTTTSSTADNRCVGGGGGGEPASSGVPPAAAPTTASGLRRRRRRHGDRDPNASRSSASSSTSSPPPSSSDEDDGDEFGGRGVVDVDSPPPVAVTRLKDLQQRLVDLDDLDLLDRHLTDDGAPERSSSFASDAGGAADMAAELRQKNKDLVLAARLGKALLSKNDELSLMNERLAEEYGDKLEVYSNEINNNNKSID